MGLFLVTGPSRDLHESNDYPAALQDLLIGLLSFWNWRILALRAGLESVHPRVEPPSWLRHSQQSLGVPRNDGHDLASDY
jgi:hypothetical protein